MKRLVLVFLAAFFPAFAFADDAAAVMKREAEKCAKAILASDFDTVTVYSHQRIIEGMGGKEKMATILKSSLGQAAAQGVSIEEASIGEPGKLEKIDGWLVGLIPQKVVMKVPGGKVEQESPLLGISEDDGKKWVFVDAGGIPKAQLEKIFPEIVGTIEIPARKPPVMKKDS